MDTTKPQIDFRRCRILKIPKQDVLYSLDPLPESKHYCRINHPEIQEGYKILDVQFEFQTQTFNFMIWHGLWEPIEEGAVIPECVPSFVTTASQYEVRKMKSW